MRLFNLLRFKSRDNLLVIGRCLLISTISNYIFILATPKLFTRILESENNPPVLMFCAIFCLEKILYIISNATSLLIEPRLTAILTERFTREVFRTKNRPETTVLMEKINIIRSKLEHIIYYSSFRLLPMLFVLGMTVIKLMNAHLGLGILSLTIAIFTVKIVCSLKLKNSFDKEQDNLGRRLEDIFDNIDFIQTNPGREREVLDALNVQIATLREKKDIMYQESCWHQFQGYALTSCGYTLVLMYLSYLYSMNSISKSNFNTYFLILGNFFKVIYDISYNIPVYTKSVEALRSAEVFVNKYFPDLYDEGLDIKHIENWDLKMDNVSFSYEDSREVISNLNLSLDEGETLILMGPSGSGKTTITSLIRGLSHPTSGNVTFGGVNVSDINPTYFREHVGVVHQNIHCLISGTIRDNIFVGCNQDDIDSFFRMIDCDVLNSIFYCDNFLDLAVSKGGSGLSGGQKQIVRLLSVIANPKLRVIILDEPTSALDFRTKAYVIELLKLLVQCGKTLIIVTHDSVLHEAIPSRLLTLR